MSSLNASTATAADPQKVLQSVFGYDRFRGDQRQVIDAVIAGESCAVLMPTGSGKSLCYQIPALCRPGLGVVVSPLIALMEDQVAALRELGIRAAALHSGLPPAEMTANFRAMHDGALDMVYVSPERLVLGDFLDLLDGLDLSLFAIDEAHCISQWGHDFRPEYQQLALLAERYPAVPRIAVTATADTPTRAEIVEKLRLDRLFTAGFDRPNIQYMVGVKDQPQKQLLSFLKTRDRTDSGIVYCLSRRKVDEVADMLRQQGYSAYAYHAGMDPLARAENQNRFLKEEGVIMVATIAFGMGINKPDVRFVAHLDLPRNIESYYQETGRAGRDGLPAVAWMVYGMQDVVLRRQMIADGDSSDMQKRLEVQKLGALLSYCEAAVCRRQVLLRYFGDTGAPCGNCDTCLQPPECFDGTVAAQKLLSCIYRTGERFGAGYVIDVLTGADDDRIRKFGHDSISTFGIGGEHSKKEWQSILRQLVSQDLVQSDMQAHGALKITETGRAFLKEKQAINLRVDKAAAVAARRGGLAGGDAVLEDAGDRALYDRLRALRLSLARAQNLPPYVVFHDRTLIEMVKAKPASLAEMGHIGGVGASKLEKYGQRFLDVLTGAATPD